VPEPDLAGLIDVGDDRLAERLVAAALDRQADDNVTAIAVELVPPP
jgi:serine/threonine protein phosphatase PrpC